MRDITKLLPICILGSALGGCSMAGTGDYFADEYAHAQQTQMPHYWGAPASCAPTDCSVSYPAAGGHVATNPYGGGVAVTPHPHAYGQSVQGYHGHQGHQGHYQNGYAPAYVNPYGGARNALRQAYTYGSLGATMYDVDSDLYGVQGRLGWQSKSIFGAELEGSAGFNEDESTLIIGGTPVTAESGIDTQIAGFGVARVPVSNKLNLLGRLGYHKTELSSEMTSGTSVTDIEFSTDGIAYGVGAEYALGRNTALRADYTRYDFDGPDADAVSLAIARKF